MLTKNYISPVLSALMLFALIFVPLNAQGHSATAENVIKFHLDEGEKAFAKGDLLNALKHFLKVRQEADGKKDAYNSCLSRYNIGVCYFLMADNGDALYYYYEAYKLCHQYELDWNLESKIANGIAGVYFEKEDYVKAREIVQPAYRTATQRRDSLILRTFTLDLALISNKLSDFKASQYYLAEAKKLLSPNSHDYLHALAIEAEAMFMQHRYADVERIAKIVLSHKADQADHAIVLIYLIAIFTDRHDYHQAYEYAQRARPLVQLKNKSYFFNTLSQLYAASGNYRQALNCKDSVVAYNDSLTQVGNKQLLDNTRVQLEVMKFSADMEHELSKMRQRHFIMILLLCVCVLLVVIGLIVVRNQRARLRHQHEMMKLQRENRQREKSMEEERIRSVEMEARYKQEIMRSSLEQKQRELSATTMFVTARNKLIEDLLCYLNDNVDIKSSPAVASLVQHLRHMLNAGNEHDQFIVNFEAANPDFAKKLQERHPELLASDIRFLAYVRMNMPIKEIATLLNINPESARRRKIRLSKKLGIESSADLYNYILHF